jgi:hypothetical protein
LSNDQSVIICIVQSCPIHLQLFVGIALAQDDPAEIACGIGRPAEMTMSETSAGLLYQEGYINRTHGSYEPNMLCEWRITSNDSTVGLGNQFEDDAIFRPHAAH